MTAQRSAWWIIAIPYTHLTVSPERRSASEAGESILCTPVCANFSRVNRTRVVSLDRPVFWSGKPQDVTRVRSEGGGGAKHVAEGGRRQPVPPAPHLGPPSGLIIHT